MSNKLPKGNGEIYWSKRTAKQYAYFKTLGINPDDIRKIEEDRVNAISFLKESGLKKGSGLPGEIEFYKQIRDLLPQFPKVPNHLISKFYFSEIDFEMKYRKQPDIEVQLYASTVDEMPKDMKDAFLKTWKKKGAK